MLEFLFQAARVGYGETEELSSFAIISLDLAILYAAQGQWDKVLEIAAGTLPILESFRLHEETLALVDLLSEAVEARKVSSSLLRQVRKAVLQDPLTTLSAL